MSERAHQIPPSLWTNDYISEPGSSTQYNECKRVCNNKCARYSAARDQCPMRFLYVTWECERAEGARAKKCVKSLRHPKFGRARTATPCKISGDATDLEANKALPRAVTARYSRMLHTTSRMCAVGTEKRCESDTICITQRLSR